MKSFSGPNRTELYTLVDTPSGRAWGTKPGHESITSKEVREAAHAEVVKHLAAKKKDKDLNEEAEPVKKKDNKCQFCRRQLTSPKHVLQHEASCPKNPANQEELVVEADQPEGVQCPVEGCVTNIKNDRWNVVNHLSKGHPEIPKDERKAMVDKMFPETERAMVKGLKERVDSAGKAIDEIKDEVTQVEEQMKNMPKARASITEIPVPREITEEIAKLPIDAKDDCPVKESNAVHRETVTIPDYPPLIDSTLDPQKEDYHIHDEDDVTVRKDIEEAIGAVVKRCFDPLMSYRMTLRQLNRMAEGAGYAVESSILENNVGGEHSVAVSISVKRKVPQ